MDTRSSPPIATAEQPHLVLTESFSVSEFVERLTGFIARQFPIFIFVTACAVAFGFVYLFTTPPLYTAHAMLVIDSSKMRVLQQQQQAALGDVPLDTSQVETQLEVLKSDGVSLAVVQTARF